MVQPGRDRNLLFNLTYYKYGSEYYQYICFDHLGVCDGWEGVVDAGGGGGHGEQRGDGEGHAGGGGLVVQPEAHPGHAHRH